MRKEYAAAAVFLISFAVYTASLNPVFHANDSPETASCAYTLGIQHPPGYPLSALTGKIFTMVPAGNIGFRVNLGAAFFAALAAAFFFLILRQTLRQGREQEASADAAAFAASLAFAFSPTFWQEALSSKGGIYTLNALLLVLTVYSLFCWEKSRQTKYFYLAALVFGVSLGNHWESMAVAVPALGLYVFLTLRKEGFSKVFSWKNIAYAAGFASLGLLLYGYLLIRAKTAWLNWGRPDNFAQLLQVILREQYADLEKARNFEVVLKQAQNAGRLLFSEFTPAGFLIAAAGAYPALRCRGKERFVLFAALALTILAALVFYFNLKEEMLWIMDVFMLPVYMCVAAFAAAAVKRGLDWNAERGTRNAEVKDAVAPSSGLRAPRLRSAAAITLALAIPLASMLGNYSRADQSRYFYAYDYGMNIIKSIETPAMALLDGDFNVMPQMYFKYVEKITQFCPVTSLFLYKPWGVINQKMECPDVKFTSGPDDQYSSKLRNIVGLNYKEKNVYVSVFRKSVEEFYPELNRMLTPAGFIMQLSFDRKATARKAEACMRKASYRGVIGGGPYQNSTTKLCVSNFSSAYMELGNALKDVGDLDRAFHYMNRAVMLANEKTKAQSYTHLGILYSSAGDNKTAMETYEKAVKADPKLPEPYSNMAGIYNGEGRYDDAITAAQKAIAAKPKFSEAYNNMAIAYYNKGDRAKAVELMEKAVEYGPMNELAKRNLAIIKGQIK